MSRKRQVFEEEELVIVEINGDLLVWADGHLSGPAHLVETAEWAHRERVQQSLGEGGKPLVSNLRKKDRPELAAAAMMAVRPHDAQIVKAPERVWRWVPALSYA